MNRWARRGLVPLAAALAVACGSPPKPPDAPAPPPVPAAAPAPAPVRVEGVVAGRHERLLVYLPREGETTAIIAAHFLGSASESWQIEDANPGLTQAVAGQPLVVPLVPRNPLGVTADGVQSVPILCYHQFGTPPSKMTVTPVSFAAQLDWLAANGYRVVRLSDLAAFQAGKKALPPKSVVITFDDAYESMYRHAYPALKQRALPATMFVYTDFIGSRDALSWPQMDEMRRSGLIDIQAHSKSHRNLMERGADESEAAYRKQLDIELKHPRTVIERNLSGTSGKVRHFAYPYGDANAIVIDAMRRNGYEIGVTVVPGSNPFYASPLLLKRVMIYGEHTLEDFDARLNGRRPPRKP
ncbi:MAG TPA: polysaccharide deacetylase family protein [Rubrivivax sp.]